jgi:hypothetical protein
MGILDWFTGSNPAASVAQGAVQGTLQGIAGVASSLKETFTGKLSPENQAAFDLKLQEMDQKIQEGQLAINAAEAANPSIFVSGWRPACGWIGALGLAYNFLIQPFLTWISTNFHILAPPLIDSSVMLNLVYALLGLIGARSFEKAKGVARD